MTQAKNGELEGLPPVTEMTRAQAKVAIEYLQDVHQLHNEEEALRLLLEKQGDHTADLLEAITQTTIAHIMKQNGLKEARIDVAEVVSGNAPVISVVCNIPGVIKYVLE